MDSFFLLKAQQWLDLMVVEEEANFNLFGFAWVAQVPFMTNTFYAWRPTWSGMRPASSVVYVKSSWTKSALASCVTGKSTARKTMSGIVNHKSR